MKKGLMGVIILLVIAIVGYVIYMGIANKKDKEPTGVENVSIRLKWFNQAQFAGIYQAKEQGYYKQDNLNVTINPGGLEISPIQMVASGTDQFGITSGNQIILARDKGIPVVAIATIYKNSPIVISSLKEKNITSPKDLVNKKVGVVYADDDEIVLKSLLKNQGIDVSKVTLEPKTFDLSQLIAGKIDAEVDYEMNEPATLKSKGLDVNLIKPRDYGINFYGDTIFTTEDMIKNHPDTVKAFVKNTIKGWEYAFANVDTSADLTLVYNDQLDKGLQKEFLNLSKDLVISGKVGESDSATWNSIQDVLIDQEIIKNRVDVEKLFSNSYLK